ncbi:MAG TPA: O-antigen ligase family protein [Thermoanaerobaculaceae bacterium]|nr:O-antigen ligase family protein [Thermoanaerobaculaceae bacterium]HRS15535.1 O-antigen ligase family protein [Thermoanaerobaculaceae bacterium]
MTPRRLAIGLGIVAAAAAWFAAREPAFGPLLWVALLLGVLWLQPAQRLLLAPWQLGLVLLVVASSWLSALDHELAFRHSLLLLAAVLVLAMARLHPLDRDGVFLLCLAVAATAAVAVMQASGGLRQAGLELASLPPAFREAAATRILVGRSFGTAALPGHFAALLLTAAPPLAAGLAAGSRWRRWAATLGLGLAGTGVLLTRSLSASLVAAAVLAVALGRGRRRGTVLAAAALAALTAATVLWRTDIASLEPVRLRWHNWQAAAQALAARPWLGVGFGGVGQAVLASPVGETNLSPYAHNTYLQLAAELGLFGLPAVGLAVAWLVGTLRRGLAADLPLALAVLVVPLHNLLDFSFYAPEVAIPWAVLAGTLAGRAPRLPDRPTPAWLLVPVLVTGVLGATLLWRGESAVGSALAAPAGERVERLVEASGWTPWTASPLLVACQVAADTPTGVGPLAALEAELGERAWVRPASAAWAECRAQLLLALGRQGEALVWVREARRRTPWRSDLVEVEKACRGR